MSNIRLPDPQIEAYESWFDQHPHIFQSEIEAVREMLPTGDKLMGIEMGIGTGRYAQALNIQEGIEPEQLPYGDLKFDFVLMLSCVSYLKRLNSALKEAFRILKHDGALIVGFMDRNSLVGKQYAEKIQESSFYQHPNFYSVDKLVNELSDAGFRHFTFRQTLFGVFENIQAFQPSKEGYGEGSFVVIKALKKFPSK